MLLFIGSSYSIRKSHSRPFFIFPHHPVLSFRLSTHATVTVEALSASTTTALR